MDAGFGVLTLSHALVLTDLLFPVASVAAVVAGASLAREGVADQVAVAR